MERVAKLEAEAAEVVRLRVENQARRAQLGRNAQNPSKPPSSDPPGVARPKKEPTGCKPGGQPRAQGPQARVARAGRGRGAASGAILLLRETASWGRPDTAPPPGSGPAAPPVKPHVTEYQLAELVCECGARTRAELCRKEPSVRAPHGDGGDLHRQVPDVEAVGARAPGGLLRRRGRARLDQQDGAGGGCSRGRGCRGVRAHPQAVLHPDETGWREARRAALALFA